MKIRKFQKLPVIIEAQQWTGDNLEDIQEFVGERVVDPGANTTMKNFLLVGEMFPNHSIKNGETGALYVQANNAWLGVVNGEWIAKDSEGFYPIKDKVFGNTYREIEWQEK